jgi:hypothetical protein
MTRRADIAARVPIVFGLRRTEAAAAVGVSVGHFDALEAQGLMPRPRMLGSVAVYDVEDLAAAFRALPHKGEAEKQLDSEYDGVQL